MTIDEYVSLDATALAALVANQEAHPHELLDVAMAHLNAVNPTLNAVIDTFESEMRTAIDDGLPSGPFTGVPFLVKDLRIAMRGHPTRFGSRLFADSEPSSQDSAIVAAYRAAGLVLFGKTNTPELGMAPVTEPALFGPTLNPWAPERTCGGSSGGAAAAVAAGLVPAAHASDGGGSIRMPASCCGLFGLKPSRGRVSTAPFAEGWGGMSTQHAVTRSVRDSAALLDVACLPQPGDPYWVDPPSRRFADAALEDPGVLRIAFSQGSLRGEPIDPVCAGAVNDAALLCEQLGHHVEEARPRYDPGAFSKAFGGLVCANIAASVDLEGARRGRPVAEHEVEPLTWDAVIDGRAMTAEDYVRATQDLQYIARSVASFFARYDVLLTSTLGQLPVPLGYFEDDRIYPGSYLEKLHRYMPNTQLFNVTGQPAMSVPLTWSDDGIPVGVQFAGRAAGEGTLFSLAAQLERARPWANKHPAHRPA